jgi:nicotinamidase-related amidase
MPARNKDLHGSAPDKSHSALLIIDVINPLDFPEANQMTRFVPSMTGAIRRLKERARRAGVPSIYINDNFGRWRSDFRQQVDFCMQRGHRGRDMVKELRPDSRDYFVLKPKHSGFFATPLDTLLRYLGARRLILTGIAGNFCVLFTANDAYMRDYKIIVPSDCVISNTETENKEALELMGKFLKADIRSSRAIRLGSAKSRRKAVRA